MHEVALTAAMQALAAIDLRDAVYVACPVSSGRRELDLMAELSLFDRDELRDRHAARWRHEVLEPNKAAAISAVIRARRRHPERSVINPSEFELDGLPQPGYDLLCAHIISHHVGYLVLTDGWQFSRGARLEAHLAIDLGLGVEDGNGRPLTSDRMFALMDEAGEVLANKGFPSEVVQRLLPHPPLVVS